MGDKTRGSINVYAQKRLAELDAESNRTPSRPVPPASPSPNAQESDSMKRLRERTEANRREREANAKTRSKSKAKRVKNPYKKPSAPVTKG